MALHLGSYRYRNMEILGIMIMGWRTSIDVIRFVRGSYLIVRTSH